MRSQGSCIPTGLPPTLCLFSRLGPTKHGPQISSGRTHRHCRGSIRALIRGDGSLPRSAVLASRPRAYAQPRRPGQEPDAWLEAAAYQDVDAVIITGGKKVDPQEVEAALRKEGLFADVAVVGVPDAEWGESLAAFIVLRAGQSATGDELSQWVRETLADYKRPRRYAFVDSLPRNPTGKVLKRELKQTLAANAVSA